MTAAEQEKPAPSTLIASEVRAEMGRAGISKSALALKLGVSPTWVNRRIGLTADVDVTMEEAERMASALGLNVLVLLDPWLRAWRDSNSQPSDP